MRSQSDCPGLEMGPTLDELKKHSIKEVDLDDKFSNEEIFILHKKKTEKIMRIMVAIMVSVLIFTIYFLLEND